MGDDPVPPGDDPARDREAFAACETIARRANANFLHAALLLPAPRRRFFWATYAAMRWIDDAVDHDFLPLSAEARERERPGILARIDGWMSQALGEERDGPMPWQIVRALSLTAGNSDLGAWPWQALAGAMRRDVSETPMTVWQDFLDYAIGASAGPATIFIYLLSARLGADGYYGSTLSEAARVYAEDLAIYCYIVHILRDLSKDVAESERLITIPEEDLAAAGLRRDQLAAAIGQKDPGIGRLGAILVARAEPFRERGHRQLDALRQSLGRVERTALTGLIRIYDQLYDRFRAGYADIFEQAPALEPALRRQHLGGDGE